MGIERKIEENRDNEKIYPQHTEIKDGGVNVIPGNNIKTTTHSPSNIPAGDFTANKTGNQFKNLTDKDRQENSAHSGNNLSEGNIFRSDCIDVQGKGM
uniref:Uncharacterized protein n=1 Tax=Magallana gigas TaxID=29159 RepID=K1PI45_MAGGI